MAVFLINICKFNGCSKTFQSLSDLISHIEDTHIDYDPKVVEQKELAQPSCLPLSYVLRFISEDARKEAPTFLSNSSNSNTNSITNNGNNGNTGNAELKRKLAIKHHSYSISSSNRSNTPTGSEMDEDEMVVTESEDSNDSWTTEEFSSEFIMRYGSRHSGGGSNGTPGNEKPFACPVPGCKKRYKNVNGIKYHSKNGHKKDGRVRKGYKCHCGKSYKTAQGLKNHALITHNSHPESVLTPQQAMKAAVDAIAVNSCGVINNNSSCAGNGGLMQRSNSPSQSLGSLSPSSSNMSSGTSNSLSSSAATASNMLQQLSNANIVTVTNVAPQQQPTQQQQMSISTHAQTVATAATPITTTTTETSYSCSHNKHNNNNNNNSSSNENCKQSSTTPTAAKYTRPTAAALAASTPTPAPSKSATTTPMQISPTFIEHKYSALAIKEKFFSNLRTSRAATATPNDASTGVVDATSPNAGNMLRAVAVGQMCALQNEHIHQNLYKKTIN
ncbi:myosin-G heavy chain isoform X2 [Drosophila busckii]|uniref:myosin-G heavy chain isoform X2 n=1 Tax=Drosophila busckii TaxID=30019 RepID=UPI00083EEDBC|nr:myosin-G heavy chain isoform X2 [Drosophila busckii]